MSCQKTIISCLPIHFTPFVKYTTGYYIIILSTLLQDIRITEYLQIYIEKDRVKINGLGIQTKPQHPTRPVPTSPFPSAQGKGRKRRQTNNFRV